MDPTGGREKKQTDRGSAHQPDPIIPNPGRSVNILTDRGNAKKERHSFRLKKKNGGTLQVKA